MSRILIMGLPGAGKTTLAEALRAELGSEANVDWFNADAIRKAFNDWDFSAEGRLRQAQRMYELSQASDKPFVICDFIAPLVVMRQIYRADWTIWVDTIAAGRFEDTNRVFEPPEHYDFRVISQDATAWASKIAPVIRGA